MDDRSFAPGRGAHAERCGRADGRDQAVAQPDAPASQRGRLDDVGNRMESPVGHQEMPEESDQQATQGGCEQDMPPGQARSEAR
jgi:hypothetical protein